MSCLPFGASFRSTLWECKPSIEAWKWVVMCLGERDHGVNPMSWSLAWPETEDTGEGGEGEDSGQKWMRILFSSVEFKVSMRFFFFNYLSQVLDKQFNCVLTLPSFLPSPHIQITFNFNRGQQSREICVVTESWLMVPRRSSQCSGPTIPPTHSSHSVFLNF